MNISCHCISPCAALRAALMELFEFLLSEREKFVDSCYVVARRAWRRGATIPCYEETASAKNTPAWFAKQITGGARESASQRHIQIENCCKQTDGFMAGLVLCQARLISAERGLIRCEIFPKIDIFIRMVIVKLSKTFIVGKSCFMGCQDLAKQPPVQISKLGASDST